jgi:hypothetical protein
LALRWLKLTLQDFPVYKRSLIAQGRSFCNATAPQCREKIAALAVDFLSDDATVRHLPRLVDLADLVDLNSQLLENGDPVNIEGTCPEQAYTSLRHGSTTIMSRVSHNINLENQLILQNEDTPNSYSKRYTMYSRPR